MGDVSQHHELYWERAEVTSYPRHANLLAIIGQFEEGKAWFWNHFLQLQINGGSYEAMNLDFCVGDLMNMVYNCPFLSCSTREAGEFAAMEDAVCDIVMNYLDQGIYVYMPVDWYYISPYESMGKTHNAHDILILGYDRADREFIAADFFGNFRYQKSRCGFQDFAEGCKNAVDLPCVLDKVLLLKPVEKIYEFNIHFVKALLRDYLKGTNSNYRFFPIKSYPDFLHNELFLFGTEIYNKLSGYLEEGDEQIKLRSYYVLYDHKNVLYCLAKYLYCNGYVIEGERFIEACNELKEQAEILKNMIIKYNMTGDKELLQRSSSLLRSIRKTETALLRDIISNLRDDPILCWGSKAIRRENKASFKGIDPDTKGEWVSNYGIDGYDIFKEKSLPASIRMVYCGFCYKEWRPWAEETNELALRLKDQNKRIESCRFFVGAAYIDILIDDGSGYEMALYIYAHGNYQRDFDISVMDGDTGLKLCGYRVFAKNEGVYVRFLVSGHVRVVLQNARIEGGVISGVFFTRI